MAEETLQEVKQEPKKVTLGDWIESHPKTTFWSRFVLWAAFSVVLPLVFIFWRFDLFKTVAKTQISGWEIIVIVLVAAFAFTVIRYIKLAFSGRYSLIGQILGGFCKIIIPLITFLLILDSLKNSIDMMIQVMGCITVCEAVAIPLNPLPKWAYDMQKDLKAEDRKETIDYLLDGFFKRKKDEGDH